MSTDTEVVTRITPRHVDSYSNRRAQEFVTEWVINKRNQRFVINFDRLMVTEVRDRLRRVNELRIEAEQRDKAPGLYMGSWFGSANLEDVAKKYVTSRLDEVTVKRSKFNYDTGDYELVEDDYTIDADDDSLVDSVHRQIMKRALRYDEVITDKFVEDDIQLCGTTACIAGEALLVANGFDRLITSPLSSGSGDAPFRMDWYKRDDKGAIITERKRVESSVYLFGDEVTIETEMDVPVVERSEGVWDMESAGGDLLGLRETFDNATRVLTPMRLFYTKHWPEHYNEMLEETGDDGVVMEQILTDLLDGNYEHWLNEYVYDGDPDEDDDDDSDPDHDDDYDTDHDDDYGTEDDSYDNDAAA